MRVMIITLCFANEFLMNELHTVRSKNAKVYAILLEPKLSIYMLMLFSPNRHTNDMIHKLESAGLGYHVSAEETEDKLGIVPTKYV